MNNNTISSSVRSSINVKPDELKLSMSTMSLSMDLLIWDAVCNRVEIPVCNRVGIPVCNRVKLFSHEYEFK